MHNWANSQLKFFFIFLALPSLVWSQNITKSPYSIVGPGELINTGNASNSGMGQISQGIRNGFEINRLNPASYSSMLQTNIEAGMIYSQGNMSSSTNSNSASNAYLSYFNIGIPVSVKKGIGVVFGTAPYSGVGYNIVTHSEIPNDTFSIPVTRSYLGHGGLSKGFLGAGIRLQKNISAGFNVNYLFGQIKSSSLLVIPAQYYMFNLVEEKQAFYGGLLIDYGLQFHKTFHENYQLTAGVSYNMETPITANRLYNLRTLPIGRGAGYKDTISNVNDEEGKMIIPSSIKFGFGLVNKDKWTFGADISTDEWTKFRNFSNSDSLRNSFAVSVGASYIPDINNIRNVFKRFEYRAGFRYEQTNLFMFNQGVDLMAISTGVGVPLGKNKSRMNISFEYMQKGVKSDKMLQESYFRMVLGVSFSDKWFQRYKYD